MSDITINHSQDDEYSERYWDQIRIKIKGKESIRASLMHVPYCCGATFLYNYKELWDYYDYDKDRHCRFSEEDITAARKLLRDHLIDSKDYDILEKCTIMWADKEEGRLHKFVKEHFPEGHIGAPRSNPNSSNDIVAGEFGI